MAKNNQPARNEQTSHIDTRHYHQPVAPHGSDLAGGILSAGLIFLLLIMLIVGLVEARQAVATASIVLAYIMMVVAPIGAGALLYLRLKHKHSLDAIRLQHAAIDLEAKSSQVRRENETHEMRLHLAQTRLNPDALGNRPYVYDPRSSTIIEATSGNYLAPVPQHWAPSNRYDYNDKSSQIAGSEQQKQLGAGLAQSPTMDYIISQLKYNALQVCLGVSANTGQPFTMDLLEGTHYRIIGGSGFGKSCEAAAILEQVTQSNDPDHLLIALLDLEHKTSRLFEDLPHVAELQVGRKRVECVATSPDEVAEHFGYLRGELDRRKKLSEYDLQRERFMLIYVEEFLSLKREVDPLLKQQMLDDFSILALRGRKYGLYLLACAQVDYSDKSLRDAMNQFNVNMSFSVKPSAARAVGFSSSDLLKTNFEAKQKGQFVLETTGCNDILLAPQFDVKAKLQRLQLPRYAGASGSVTPGVSSVLDAPQKPYIVSSHPDNTDETPKIAPAWEAKLQQVWELQERHYTQTEIIEKVWDCSKGTNAKYSAAREEYLQIDAQIKQRRLLVESEEAE